MTECKRCGTHDDDAKRVSVDGEEYVLCPECQGVVGRRLSTPRTNGLRTYGRRINRHSGP